MPFDNEFNKHKPDIRRYGSWCDVFTLVLQRENVYLDSIVYFLNVINRLPTKKATGCQIQKLDLATYVNDNYFLVFQI